ncbi:hypothetical protein [Nannocystis punicea]|uniref:Concanavalin A-like lectin/glucanases superfamily protein n=1 Tax=Nannocystis punicea TaxID=2995304 RepID=A0ABY7H1T1_9BACT|nr:hypothetical protein [Nannocystis poenicansa]WAS93188.1 hypothetical protein O0S08_44055 [Nannocystis poenicansa]
MPRPHLRRLAALAFFLLACSYDGSGLVSVGEPPSTTTSTGTTTGEPALTTTDAPLTTTGGPDLSTTGTTAPVDPTTDATTTTTTSSTSTTGETSTTTGDETTGPPPPLLIDDGLLVRYFLDEAASGQSPTHALDAAPDPLDLPLVYDGMGGMNPVYVEEAGHRGLRWPMPGLDGRATIAAADTKLQSGLQNRTAATIEIVVEVDAVTDLGSRLTHIGRGIEPGHFTLRSSKIDRLEFYWKGDVLAGVWPVDWNGLGRAVVHVVVDTGQPEPIHRIRLYIDGVVVADGTDIALVPPNQNEAIAIPTDPNIPLHFTLGNRGVDVDRSFQGTLYYAAIYAAALSETQLAANADILAGLDDAP